MQISLKLCNILINPIFSSKIIRIYSSKKLSYCTWLGFSVHIWIWHFSIKLKTMILALFGLWNHIFFPNQDTTLRTLIIVRSGIIVQTGFFPPTLLIFQGKNYPHNLSRRNWNVLKWPVYWNNKFLQRLYFKLMSILH